MWVWNDKVSVSIGRQSKWNDFNIAGRCTMAQLFIICIILAGFDIEIILFPGIEDLCTKRDELHKQILSEEEEKSKIQNDIRILTERLSKINESLAKKISTRNEYDKTISETEAAYMKVLKYFYFPRILFHCKVL